MDSTDWDARYAGTELLWTAEPNRFVAAEVSDVPAGRALDLACGEGRNALWLAGRGWQVTAVDFSRVALDKGRQLAAHRGVEVEWVLADVTTYDPPAHAFDLVLLAYLQMPRDALRTVLGHARDGVAPGGTLLVVAHDAANLTDGYGGPQHPSVLYEADDVVAALSGFVVHRAGPVERPVATDAGEAIAIDLLVRAEAPAEDVANA